MQRIIVLSSYLKLSIIQLTMRKTGLLLISLLFCASCADKHDHKGQTPLVEVDGNFLYKRRPSGRAPPPVCQKMTVFFSPSTTSVAG